MALASGDSLGRYTIERLLGSGAMGEVHLARDPRIDRRVALKTLRLATVRPGEVEAMSERLLREARAAGRLLHPHIVTLFDAGEQDGLLYLAFEYIPGSDLAVRLRKGPPLALGEALRIARETCEGLDFAHRHGIVHRDVKPSNLMLGPDGTVKISDFGIAKLSGESQELTVSGSVMGSPHYLSPEQVRGEPLDGRSDLFSLGIVLYEMIAGRRPFEGETLTTLVYQILHKEPPELPPLRDRLQPAVPQLLSWFLAKDRELRVPDARAAVDGIAALVASLPGELLALPAVRHEEGTLLLDDRSIGELRTRPADAAADGPPPPPPGVAGELSAGSPAGGVPTAAGGAVGTGPGPPAGIDRSAGAGVAASAVPLSGSYAVPGARRERRPPWALIAAAVIVVAGLAAGALFLRSPDTERLASRPLERPAAFEEAEPAGRTATSSGAVSPTPGVGEFGAARSTGGSGGAGGAGVQPPTTAVVPVPPARPPAGSAARQPSPSAEPPPVAATRQVGDRREALPSPGREPAVGDPDDATVDLPVEDPPSTRRRRIGLPRSIGAVEAFDETISSGMRLVFQVQPTDAYVLLDGTVVGQVHEFSAQARRPLELPSEGEHVVVLRRAGMGDRTIRVDARRDGPAVTPLVGRLLPLAADDTPLHELESHRVGKAIAFDVEPADAEVLVDGRRVGPASRYSGGRLRRGEWLELPLGVHRVSLVAPGHRRVDLAIDVTSGALEARKRIEITLPPLPPGAQR